MKKLLILLIVMFLITGCTFKKVNLESIENITDKILFTKNKLYNINLEGYKYYLPLGTSIINKTDYNTTIKDKNRKYYLYVDAIAYYHKVTRDYEENSNAFYSKKLNNGKLEGYLEINEINNRYFIEIMYNYAKIETYIDKKDLKESLVNVSYILSSVKYNGNIIKMLLENDTLKYDEESLDIFKPKRKDGNFLDYVDTYDKYDKSKSQKPDEDNLLTEESFE